MIGTRVVEVLAVLEATDMREYAAEIGSLTTQALDAGARPADLMDCHVDAWYAAAATTGLDPSTLLPVDPEGLEAVVYLDEFFADRDSRPEASAALKGGA